MDLIKTPEAARLLGVGPTTVKRWVDQGRLNCVTTPGGHRRFKRSDVEYMRLALGGELDDFTVRCLQHMLSEVDAYGLQATCIEMRGQLGSWWQVADRFGAVLTDLGRRWQAGECSVGQEHAASRQLQDSLTACGAALPSPPNEPLCVLAAVEDELHTLGLSLAELCLREAGLESLWLGAPTPTSVLIETIERRSPAIVALSASAWSSDADLLLQHYGQIAKACRRCSATLVLGGAGNWPQRPAYGYRVHGFAEFVGILAFSKGQDLAQSRP